MRTRLTLVVDLCPGDRVRVDGRPCTIVRISSDPDDLSRLCLLLSSGRGLPEYAIIRRVRETLPLLVPEGAAR